MSRGNVIDPRTIRTTVHPSAVLIDMVFTGGRVKDVRPVGRVKRVTRGRKMLFRASTIRTFNRMPVGMSRVGVSVLDSDKRGLGKPGKVNFLCVEGKIGVHSFVRNKTRREGHHTNARGIPNVMKCKGTMRLTVTSVRREVGRRARLHSCTVTEVRGRVPCYELGKSHIGHIPGGVGFDFRFIRKRSLLVVLSVGKVYTSDNSTYASNSLSPSRILLTVKLPRRVTRNSLHVSVNTSAAGRSVSCAVSRLGRVITRLHDVSPLCRSFVGGRRGGTWTEVAWGGGAGWFLGGGVGGVRRLCGMCEGNGKSFPTSGGYEKG